MRVERSLTAVSCALRGCILVTLAWVCLGAAIAQAAPNVVSTLRPIDALVAGVMEGVGAPALLLEGSASPHAYSLRPSQSQALQNADLVFWIGPEMETFLVKPLRNLALKGRVVTLSGVENIMLLPVRPPGALGEPEASSVQNTGHDHETARFDMHIWLDPRNAAAMVRAIAANLIEADSANRDIYQTNSIAMLVRLDALERQINAILTGNAKGLAPYIVFHDAYRYFEKRFGIGPIAVISLDPEHPPGAARIRALKKQISAAQAVCIFTEPQFEPRIAQRLAEGSNARLAVLDPLGASQGKGSALYFALLADIAHNIRACAG